MPEYKIKKGRTKPKDTPVEQWTTDHLCEYYTTEFKRLYGIETRRPIGQIKCHINQKTVNRLFRMEGRSISVHPNGLYKEFIDWLLSRKTVKNMRVWYFSKDDIMADFLDDRAKERLDAECGSFKDLQDLEQKRIEAAKEFWGEDWDK